MRPGVSMRIRQGLLLCALVLAVLGMHHLALAPDDAAPRLCHQPAAPSSGPADSTGTGHDLMHPCLAILGASAWLFLFAWLSTAFGDGGLEAVRPRVLATRARRRRRSTGRSLLTSVCVLRI
jgi:hypothetical protein